MLSPDEEDEEGQRVPIGSAVDPKAPAPVASAQRGIRTHMGERRMPVAFTKGIASHGSAEVLFILRVTLCTPRGA